eukprot:TRINITY_DN2262_c0_g4_i2.p1 TRINITY_DN2262_c0_g4~~TRINITY_DN2262_c0_g4_i2.p1  ORF type:complete len:169 (+),score=29.49 TRINITY_DN2262_c0_g4_i2:436-942(+)
MITIGTILDDPNTIKSFKRGYLSFAGSGPNSRTTELFISYQDNAYLGQQPWEVPIGYVLRGMDVIDRLYDGYGDVPPFGQGPSQKEIYAAGNQYLEEKFPLLSRFGTCKIINLKELATPAISPQLDQTAQVDQTAQEGNILFIAGIGIVVVFLVVFTTLLRKPMYKHL